MRVKIRKSTTLDPDFPWEYTVEDMPPREDALDYGNVESYRRAIECAEYALKNPDEVRGFPWPEVQP